VYSQRRQFRLLTDHLVQSGPSFPHPLDVSIDATSGRVTVRYSDDGKEKVIDDRVELPSDLATGMLLTLLKNVSRDVPTTVSMLFATPKPQLVAPASRPASRLPSARSPPTNNPPDRRPTSSPPEQRRPIARCPSRRHRRRIHRTAGPS